MVRITGFVVLAVYATLCASQPVEKLPVLKQFPSEVVFRENKEFVLECVTEGKVEGVTYKWLKNGKQFTPNADIVQRDNEGTLVFKSPNKDDEGEYQCLAESSYGVATSSVTLKRVFIDLPKVPTLQRHKPVEGKMYILECSIPNGYPKPEIVWKYVSLSDPKDSRMDFGRRVTISPIGDLHFTNVTKEDTSKSHKYVCLAKSPVDGAEAVLADHILEEVLPNTGPVDHELYPQFVTNDFTTTVGNVTMIYCIYGGTPWAFPKWFKNGKALTTQPGDRVTVYNRTSGRRLLIKDTQLEDQGNYTCIVNNELGAPQQYTMELTVVSAPQFTKQPEQKYIVKAGQDLTIPCHVAGVPNPKVSWSKNVKDLQSKVHIQGAVVGNVTVTDLTIKNLQKDDGGYYGCQGVNANGKVYAEALVVVQ